MNIRNVKELKAFALERLGNAGAQKKIVLIYSGLVVGMSAVVLLLQYLLGLQIDETSGLGGIGLRSILSALQTMLPLVQSVITMCLSLGYLAAMLRIARGQYVSPQTLRLGFDRFWPLLRLAILQSLLYGGTALAAMYAASFIFLMTPLAEPMMEILMPLMGGLAAASDPMAAISDVSYAQLLKAMWPVFPIFGVVLCILIIPMLLRYRMAEYVLIDKPALGAFAAMRESRLMMRRNCWNLLRLDFGLWWYHAAVFLATAVSYGDQLLPMAGISLPFSAQGNYYLFFVLYQILQLALCFFLRNRVEVAYALAYDAVKPKETPQSGVVLGSIFQM